jgi:hypothetical protein
MDSKESNITQLHCKPELQLLVFSNDLCGASFI